MGETPRERKGSRRCRLLRHRNTPASINANPTAERMVLRLMTSVLWLPIPESPSFEGSEISVADGVPVEKLVVSVSIVSVVGPSPDDCRSTVLEGSESPASGVAVCTPVDSGAALVRGPDKVGEGGPVAPGTKRVSVVVVALMLGINHGGGPFHCRGSIKSPARTSECWSRPRDTTGKASTSHPNTAAQSSTSSIDDRVMVHTFPGIDGGFGGGGMRGRGKASIPRC